MKLRPILYSPPMVQSILDGIKTMTRRTKGLEDSTTVAKNPNAPGWFLNENGEAIKCPYGDVGDVLWVREEHKISYYPKSKEWLIEFKDGSFKKVYYKKLSLSLNKRLQKRKTLGKWQRARFLPKELCRLFLKIKSITVERLNDISEDDAIAEGIEPVDSFNSGEGKPKKQLYKNYLPFGYKEVPAKDSFQSLWLSINGVNSWKDNPWVWVIEFEQIEKPADFLTTNN